MGSVSCPLTACSSLSEQCSSVLLNRAKCKALLPYLNRAKEIFDPSARASAGGEFCAAVGRAQHLVDESSDHNEWPLKAVELWECSEHFVELFVDLCWSARVMLTCYRSETLEQERVLNAEEQEILLSLSQEQERLLNSRTATATAGLLETEHDVDKRELGDMVFQSLDSPDLKEDDDKFQLVHLLNDRIKDQKSWHPPILTSFKFDRQIKMSSSDSSNRGQDGIVWRFEWVYKKRFAVKMCLPHIDYEKTFRDEFNFLDKHRSSYIVGVVGYWELKKPVPRYRTPWSKHKVTVRPFLVMEAMDCNLEELISRYRKSRRGHGFSVLETIKLMLPVSKALRFLHAKDVAHRDVKLKNIMCRNVASGNIDDVVVKLIDFGEAREYVTDTNDKSDSVFFADISGASGDYYPPGRAGTYGFMAPEMFSSEGCKKLESADVFSFAMAFVEVLTWRREETGVQVGKDVQDELNRGERPALPKDLPPYIHFIVESCWNADPYMRPSFDHICSMLQNAKLLILDPRFGEGDDPFSYRDATFVPRDYKEFCRIRGFPHLACQSLSGNWEVVPLLLNSMYELNAWTNGYLCQDFLYLW